ncbi:MAG: hypothetical protein JW888_04435 [Pirellulales bacterium]|nr:hypothetical protein [Pirellulales bacterium]
MSYQVSRWRLITCVILCLVVGGFVVPAFGEVVSFSIHVDAIDPVFGEADEEYSNPLLLQPAAFEAASIAGVPAVSLTDGTLILTITPVDGVISTITFSEGGDYTLAGGLTAPSQAYVSAALLVDFVSAKVNGEEVDYLNLDRKVTFTRNRSFSPGGAPDQDFWSLTTTFDIAGALAAVPEAEGDVTELKLSIDNTLLAMSQLSSSAFIAKKWLRIDINDEDVPDVPEPTAVVLLVCGCCALLARRRI